MCSLAKVKGNTEFQLKRNHNWHVTTIIKTQKIEK